MPNSLCATLGIKEILLCEYEVLISSLYKKFLAGMIISATSLLSFSYKPK
jgi:hypothetical protein